MFYAFQGIYENAITMLGLHCNGECINSTWININEVANGVTM